MKSARTSSIIVTIILLGSIGCGLVNIRPKLEWVRTWGGPYHDDADEIAVDSSGNIWVTSSLDLQPELMESSPPLQALYCYSPSGDRIESREWDDAGLYFSDVVLDSDDNLYLTVNFSGTVDFDPGDAEYLVAADSDSDAAIVKFDSSGELLWMEHWGQVNSDPDALGMIIWSSAVDHECNVYVCGAFGGVVDFDPGPANAVYTSQGDSDIFFSKFNSNGEFQWVRALTGSQQDIGDYPNSISVDRDGNLYISGSVAFDGPVDMDPGQDQYPVTGDVFGTFLSKYNPSGEFQWVRMLDEIFMPSLITDIEGRSFVYSMSYEFVDPESGEEFDITSGSMDFTTRRKLTLDCYNPDGETEWSRSWETDKTWFFTSLSCDNGGNIYAIGTEREVIEFNREDDTSTHESGDSILKINRYSDSGSLLSSVSLGDSTNWHFRSVAFDNQNNIIMAGYFLDSHDFDPRATEVIITSNGMTDAFLMKLSQ